MVAASNNADLLVVGGGVLGAFHAYHAMQLGLTVILLEKDAAPVGATVRNFGQVVPSGLDQHWQQFGRESLQIYRTLQDEIDLSVRQLGSIYLASDDDEVTLLEELRAINNANDYPSELWTAQQCCDRYPQLRSNYCKAGLFFPHEVSVNPRVMIHQLHRYLTEQPVFQSVFGACVHSLFVQGDGRVTATTTDARTFTADHAIVCSGSDFQLLFPEVFRQSDLQSVRLQMLRLIPQPNIQIPGNVLTGLSIRRYECFAQCASWREIKEREQIDSFWKQWGIHILFKQEADGSIIIGDSHEYFRTQDRETIPFDLRHDVNEYFISEGQKIFDLPRWDIESAWHGVYCQTSHPSGIFTHTMDDRIHIVTGIGGKGMTSSAGFARQSLQEIYND